MPQVSKRGQDMAASPIRKLVPLANGARARGLKVYGLNIGQPDLPSPPEAFEALKKIEPGVLAYSPSEGIKPLRDKMAEYYHRFGIDVTPEDIIVTTGGSEALLLLFEAALDPGDEIIMPEPAYANYMGFAHMAGAKIVTVKSNIENGFALPPVEEFEKLITPRTKAILICNPNNPTGYLYSREELEQLRDIVKKHDLYLFADEVYREYCYTEEPYFSALQLKGVEDRVVVVDSVSKRYSECGIRIGAIVTRDEKLRQAIMKFAQARLSPPLLGQLVALASIDTTAEYMKESYDEYLARRNFMIEGINKIPGCFTPMPKGAFYTVVRLPVEDAEDFVKWCLTDFEKDGATVFMAPAAGFYSTPGAGKDEVRVAYVLKKEDLAKALEVLEAALAAYPGKKKA